MSVKDFYENELEAVGLQSPFKDGCIENLVSEFSKMI
jgi:hypothetical protein